MDSIGYLNDYIKRSGYPDIFTVSEEQHFFSQSGKITSIYIFDFKADVPNLKKLASKFAPEHYLIKEDSLTYRFQIESENKKEVYRLVVEFINRINRVIYETLFSEQCLLKIEVASDLSNKNEGRKKRKLPLRNPNQRPTIINMDRSIARMRAETREFLNRLRY